MSLELQYRINSDPRLKQFLRENSYWYKYLNRSNTYLKPFISDMKDKYKLKTTDKINKLTNNISMVRAFLDVLK
ncbi:MAG: YlbE-like family protein [Bacilli bacterium]|jgi:hypothetical protein|nr:YlbE-like family protein [Bacilli bacterium]CDE96129.1 uncharacterized protein BN809_01200 [Clostridium sp. CAG:914]